MNFEFDRFSYISFKIINLGLVAFTLKHFTRNCIALPHYMNEILLLKLAFILLYLDSVALHIQHCKITGRMHTDLPIKNIRCDANSWNFSSCMRGVD